MILSDNVKKEGKVVLTALPEKDTIKIDFADNAFPDEAKLVTFNLLDEKLEPYRIQINAFNQGPTLGDKISPEFKLENESGKDKIDRDIGESPHDENNNQSDSKNHKPGR